MEIFNAIGLKIPHGKTLNDLAADAERRGEASLTARSSGTVHGRCWRIGLGLEVWTTVYESKTGEMFYADCRPGFRARYTQNIHNWVLRVNEKEGEATIEGHIKNYTKRVSFQLQNLTEAGAKNFEQAIITVGLCGLAYRAKVLKRNAGCDLKPLEKIEANRQAKKVDWRLTGRVINFNTLRNPFSGQDLYWLHLDLNDFRLELLVNREILKADDLCVGAIIEADVWLQGHVVSQSTFFSNYEGVDWSVNAADFWQNYKKLN